MLCGEIMNGNDKKLIAIFCSMIVVLLIAVALVVSIFRDDGAKNGEVYYVPQTTEASVNVNNYAENKPFQNNSAETTTVILQETVVAETTTQKIAVQDTTSNAVLTPDESLSILTSAINKTKRFSGNVSVNHTESFDAEVTDCTGGSVVASVADSIVSMVLKPTAEVLLFSGGTAVNSEGAAVQMLLPQDGDFSLDMSAVQSISAVTEAGVTEINVTLIPERVDAFTVPEINASAIGYLDIASLDLSILEITSSDINYTGSTINATVNKDGYIDRITYTIPMHIEASAKSGIISGSAVFDGKQTEIWDFNWS